MAKQLVFQEDAQQALLNGMEKLAKAVVTTLGPKGKNVALDQGWGAPKIVHDGVSVAREIFLQDPFQNMGAQLIKEASMKTNDSAGDGTTTSTLLAWQIVKYGLKHVASGANPMLLQRGIQKAIDVVVEEIRKMALPVDDEKAITQVATISAADASIGKLIAEAINKVGQDGVITVEEGRGLQTEIAYKDGMEFDKGYVSPYMVTNPERMTVELNKPKILITDHHISAISQLLPFLEAFAADKANTDLLIIADNLDGEALMLVLRNLKRFRIVAVRAPEFGDRRTPILEDLAILTGAHVVAQDQGNKLENVVSLGDWCGTAEKVIVSADSTKIVGGSGDPDVIQQRIETLKAQIETADGTIAREKLQDRLARLTGGVAVVNVGATTEVEMKDKKERVIDAVAATKSAIDEGIIPGGGVALLRARKALKRNSTALQQEEKIAFDIVYAALGEPIKWILANAGEDAEYLARRVDMAKHKNTGYDVMTQRFVDTIKEGIVDPAKVTRLALQNAASIAAMVLTTEVLVTDIIEKPQA